MKLEIERKFLVKNDNWRALPAVSFDCVQGYIVNRPEMVVRIRIMDDKGFLTIKAFKGNYTRVEFEYEIPVTDADILLKNFCKTTLIEKTRHKIMIGNILWEVDEFKGLNKGLILAEVELTSESQKITLPDWIGTEVSTDPKYHNANLSKNPYSTWAR